MSTIEATHVVLRSGQSTCQAKGLSEWSTGGWGAIYPTEQGCVVGSNLTNFVSVLLFGRACAGKCYERL